MYKYAVDVWMRFKKKSPQIFGRRTQILNQALSFAPGSDSRALRLVAHSSRSCSWALYCYTQYTSISHSLRLYIHFWNTPSRTRSAASSCMLNTLSITLFEYTLYDFLMLSTHFGYTF